MLNKLLTIAVPHYKESEQEIFPLLSSIATQVGLDFSTLEVIIATDGGGAEPLDENFLSLFPFDTKQLRLEKNGGCGPARQAAIDIASGKYILCCDADDSLFSVTVLAALLDEAEANHADVLLSDFVEEVRNPDGSTSFKIIKPTACWMHGKLLRRDFLNYRNIRFRPDLRDHEDSYFLGLAITLAENLRYLEMPTYLWRFNSNSITRRDNHAYAYEKHPEYIQAVKLAFQEIQCVRPELVPSRVVQFIHYNFFLLHRADWLQPEREALLQAAEQAFAQYMAPFANSYYDADPAEIAASYNAERAKTLPMVESETVSAWLQRIHFGCASESMP